VLGRDLGLLAARFETVATSFVFVAVGSSSALSSRVPDVVRLLDDELTSVT